MGTRCKKKDSQLGGFISAFHQRNSIFSGTQISKGASDVAAAMKTFTAVIVVMIIQKTIGLYFSSTQEEKC
jgi:preprotein translocase subunit SecG